MAVYYKFKSARDYDSIAMDGPFISVGLLKEKIFESKHLGKGTDFDLVVTNAQTNEEYLDEATLIPKNTSVLIRRVPGRPRMPIVTDSEHRVEDMVENTEPERTSFLGVNSSVNPEPDWDDLGGDLYDIPEVFPVQQSYAAPDIPPTNKADEDSKLKALIDTPVLDWQNQGPDGYGSGRGFGRGMNGRMGGRGFGRTGVFEKKTPPQGYICHRCKVPGHYIQHCPTNGDPNYDIKRVKPPTGIPKSMLIATPDGSYALPSGAVAVLRPNEAAFEKEIEGLPSTRSVGDLPPELHCPLCKEVMKDAVLTSKCCFKSFCDKCIRNYITSKSVCVCGATNTLADDLLPNKTLRDTINRILESGNDSTDNAGSAFQVQDMESARCPQPKIPSPTLSAASKGENKPLPLSDEALKTQGTVDEVKPVLAPQQMLENVRNTKVADASEATHESMSVKEPASQGSAPLVDEEVQQRLASVEAGKKRKKKKVRMPANEMQWKTPQDLAAENYMMHMGPSAYNPYWNGMQPGMGMDGYMPPYGAPMPYMGYGMGPMDMPFGGPFPPDAFGGQGYMMPMVPPPQRDLADFGMGMGMNGMNVGPPPIMSREEFEARKADLRRKRENERRGQRELSKDREYGREVHGDGDMPPMKSKSKSSLAPRSPSPDYSRDRDHHRHYRYERSSPPPEPTRDRDRERRPSRDILDPLPPPRPPKRRSDHHHDRDREREPSAKDYDDEKPRQKRHRSESSSSKPADAETAPPPSKPSSAKQAAETASAKSKASVFSRISFPEGEANKKRKSSPSAKEAPGGLKELANGFHDHEYSKSSKVAAAPAVSTSSRKTTSAVSSPAVDYESSDDDRHFKRKKKSSRYAEASPPAVQVEEEPSRHSRGSRDREREHRRPR
ncbi:E3 ubiquitin ligase PARAQUAT TOLERANCE 3-like isoform X2 [Argentina anserina]|uniref:E3 ubiquitin ligase PARAQUAT TOLERANCE 3-like isoform X2 n=1 Tax=Argentina anserina TaxID=57926 RepID=UPI00217624F2|nr:E3 ubiquitin ligase PARAQUAT TOLERANCE 3-like isoform X2 [Potentilla anserina]